MSESITLARSFDMEALRSNAGWLYLFDLSLPVRPPHEDEAEAYALRQEDGTYAALLDGPVIDEADAVLAEQAQQTYEEAGRPDDEPAALTEAREAALDRFHEAHAEQAQRGRYPAAAEDPGSAS